MTVENVARNILMSFHSQDNVIIIIMPRYGSIIMLAQWQYRRHSSPQQSCRKVIYSSYKVIYSSYKVIYTSY